MPAAIVTSKGQVTIPKAVREELGIETGTSLTFVRTPQGYLLRPTGKSLARLRGIVKYDGPPVTIEDMNEAVLDAVAEDDARIRREWHR